MTHYAEIHSASAFSFLAASSLPEDLVHQASEKGIEAMALVDKNGVYGAPRFFTAAKKAGIRALVGSEITTDGTELVLLVENRTGYKNLCKLITAGAAGRAKGDAQFTWELVEEHAAGLHCLTRGDENRIDKIAGIFKKRTHVELQRHHIREEEHRNVALIDTARRKRLPLVVSNGVRYARPEDKTLHDVLTCIREGRNVENAGQLLGINRERHIKGAAEMSALFADLPQALDHTWELARRLDFTLADLGYQFPDYPLPPGESAMSYLRKITWNGAKVRFRPLTAKAQRQIEKELAMIEKLDLAGYFLIVWDIVQFCQREKILVQGRGSAANSAVCYALSITAVDPVSMDLLFERFLSEERGEWPDIDLDLPSGDQREKAIQHVYKTYGAHGAAMTANVITYRDRSAAREVAKALGFSLEQADKLSKCLGSWNFGEIRDLGVIEQSVIPRREDGEESPSHVAGGSRAARGMTPNFRMTEGAAALASAGFDAGDLRVRHFMHLQMRIQNLPRHLGQHSGGMVMARGRLDEIVPLEPAAMPGRVVIQWDKDDCADLGLIKVDLLGLGMLQAIEECIPLIRTKEKIDVDLAHLPQDDPLVYKMLNEADTVGLFQVESRAQMASLPRNAPKTFYDIVVQVAIIRPGPIVGGMIKPFFDRRQGKAPVEYPHPCLEPILKRTLGVPLFQEQLLRIAMVAANFTGGEAEELRRAMGFKRSMERMAEIETRLRDGMTKNGIEAKAQDQIVKSITSFALYGFPESHAASFALIAYASAYLKAHHPAAFTASLLNAWPMGFYHPATVVKDAQRHGVRVLPIDVNHSGWSTRWENGAVRLGMRFVKGLRETTARAIEAAQPFKNADDVARRARVRDDQLTKLAYAGALASMRMTRRGALWQAAQAARPAGELFEPSVIPSVSEGPGWAGRNDERPRTAHPPRSLAEPALSEAEGLGMTCEPHPLPEMSAGEETLADYAAMELTTGPHLLTHFRKQLKAEGIVTAKEMKRLPNGRRVTTAGAVIVRQRPGTAKGFVFLTLEDETGISQAIVHPDLFRDHRALIVGSPGLIVEGILQNSEGQCSVRAETFRALDGIGEVASHDFH